MARKIDIELTSARSDGTWTWRVAGAKQPKGVLDGPLLPEGAKVGDVLRAEAEFELEGTVITSVQAAPGKRPDPERLHLLTDARPFEPVITTLVPKGAGRPSRDRRLFGEVAPDRDRGRPPRPADRGERPDRGPRPDRASRPASAERPAGDAPEHAERGPRPDRPPRTEGDRTPRRSSGPGRERPAANRQGENGEKRGDHAPSGPPRPKRLSPGTAHRNAVLESLPPEERAIAEQLLQGGIPAVRRAMQEQNAKAREEGRPEVQPDALLALAEELLPRLKGAEWRDRAEAAAKDVDEIHLRDLRSIVAGADAGARDAESRILAKTLREALEGRETAEREAWVTDITTCLDEGRVTRALRVAGRPPDPRTRFPTELMQRLGEAASAAMHPDAPVDRWTALLAAVLESPVRRAVKPVGLPKAPGDALLAAARQASGRIPALASLLGLDMPPPPGPPRAGMRISQHGRPVPPPPRRPPPPRTAPAPVPAPAPVEAAPVEAAPVEAAPVAAALTEAVPVEAAPVEPAPIDEAPDALPADVPSPGAAPVTSADPSAAETGAFEDAPADTEAG